MARRARLRRAAVRCARTSMPKPDGFRRIARWQGSGRAQLWLVACSDDTSNPKAAHRERQAAPRRRQGTTGDGGAVSGGGSTGDGGSGEVGGRQL
jgi:hypothetical protein